MALANPPVKRGRGTLPLIDAEKVENKRLRDLIKAREVVAVLKA
jgi:hypothetical protein